MKEEAFIHTALCNYIRVNYPEVIFTSDLSGLRLPIGVATQIKALKSRRGIPDLIVFYPAGGYHGLLIEIKTEGASVFRKDGAIKSNPHYREQQEVIMQLRELGYAAYFVQGLSSGKKCIENYMTLGLTAREQNQRSPAGQDECPTIYT